MKVTKYIAIARGAWGRGDTPEEARAQCLKAGAKKRETMFCTRYDYDDAKQWYSVDSFGERTPITDKAELLPSVTRYGQAEWVGTQFDHCEWVGGVLRVYDPAELTASPGGSGHYLPADRKGLKPKRATMTAAK